MKNSGVYSVAQIAEILQVSTKTAYRLVRDGDIQAIRVRGQIRISSSALDDYLGGSSNNERTDSRKLV